MRIAYVCADPGVPVFGRKGCSVHVQEMIRTFRRGGPDVELFAARADGPPPPELEGVRVHRLPAVRAAAPGIDAVEVLNRALAVGLSQAAPFDMVYERYSLWSAAAMEHAHAAGGRGGDACLQCGERTAGRLRGGGRLARAPAGGAGPRASRPERGRSRPFPARRAACTARRAGDLHGRVRGLDERLARRAGPDRRVRGAA